MSLVSTNPLNLRSQFPQASISNILRLRLFCQVYQYTPGNLVVGKVPLSTTESSHPDSIVHLEINTGGMSLSTDATIEGAVLALNGFFDGNAFEPFSFVVIDIDNEEWKVLQRLEKLHDF